MAFTIFGVGPGQIDETEWAELFDQLTTEVATGMAPTVATGTRLITIGAGKAAAAGVLAKNSASANVTLAANNAANPRIDIVCCELDWAGTGTASLVVEEGAAGVNPVPPVLTRDEGDTWQIPLAQVRVDPGVGQISADAFTDVRPGLRTSKVQRANIDAVSVGAGQPPKTVAIIDVPDPGWAYRLAVNAVIGVTPVTSGRALGICRVDGVGLCTGRAGQECGSDIVLAPDATGSRTGPAVVRFLLEAPDTITGGPVGSVPEYSQARVIVVPA